MSQSIPSPSSTPAATAEAKALFTQSVVDTESYMSDPCPALDPVYSEFRNAEVKKVPVFRIFGVTPRGQKVCANIHGVFPYFYILDDGSSELELALEIDRALNENFVESVPSTSAKTTNYNNRRYSPHHVFKIIKVSGRPLYGYYSKDSIFFKIYFYNPWTASKAAGLLSKGKIFGKMYDTFETHISFLLQFYMDYGIFGMGLAHFTSIYFRREFTDSYLGNEEEELEAIDSYERFWDLNQIPDSYLSSAVAGKTTRSEIEIDVIASNIIISPVNKSQLQLIINPGIEAIWEDERSRRVANALSSNIEMPESQCRDLNYEMLPTEEKFASKLWDKLLNYREKNDSQLSQHSAKSNFSDSSYENLPPASQILHNLPCSEHDLTLLSQSQSQTFTQDDDNDENENENDDNFLELLERMAARKLLDCENIEDQLNKSIDEDEEFEKDDENESESDCKKNDDDVWNDTFMTPSLEAFLNEAECEFQIHKQQDKSPPKEAEVVDVSLNSQELETIIVDEIEKWESNRNNSDPKDMEVEENEVENDLFPEQIEVENDPFPDQQIVQQNFEFQVHKKLDKSPPKEAEEADVILNSQELETIIVGEIEKWESNRNNSDSKDMEVEVIEVENENEVENDVENDLFPEQIVQQNSECEFQVSNHKQNKSPSKKAKDKIKKFENIRNKSDPKDMEVEVIDVEDEVENEIDPFPDQQIVQQNSEWEFQVSNSNHKKQDKSPPKEAKVADDSLNTEDLETIVNAEIEKMESNRNNSDPKDMEVEVIDVEDDDEVENEIDPFPDQQMQIVQQNSENFETQGIIFTEYSQEIWSDLHENICGGDGDNDESRIEEDRDIFSDLDHDSDSESEKEKGENENENESTTSHIEELPSTETETEEDEKQQGQESMDMEQEITISDNEDDENDENEVIILDNEDDENEIILSDIEDNDDDENEILGIQSFYEYSSPVDNNFDINISLNSPEYCQSPSGQNSPDFFEGLDDNDNDNNNGNTEETENENDDDTPNQLVQSTIKSNRSRVVDSDSEDDNDTDDTSSSEAEETTIKNKVKKERPDPLNIQYKRVEKKRSRKRKALKREQLEQVCRSHPNNPNVEEWIPLKHFPSQKLFKRWLSQKISDDYNNEVSVSSDCSSDGNSNGDCKPKPCSKNANNDVNINFDDSLCESQEPAAFHQAIKKSEMVQTVVQFRGGNMEDMSDEDENSPAYSPASSQCQSQSQSKRSIPGNGNKLDYDYGEISPKSMISTPKSRRMRGLDIRKLSWQNPIESSEGEDELSPKSPANSNTLRKDLRKETLIKCSNSNANTNSPNSNSESFIGSTPEKGDTSEIDGPRLDNTFGFKHNVSNYQNVRPAQKHQYLTTMCVEVFCSIRGELLPNPEFDQILGIFILIHNDVPDDDIKPKYYYASLITTLESIPYCRSYFGDSTQFEEYNCQFYPDEISLLQSFISVVREWDPEIMVGYEVERASLGYIMERSRRLGINMPKELSRLLPVISPYQNQNKTSSEAAINQIESWNGNIQGRIILNLWNILRKEITVCSYTFESAAYHILHQRYPHFDHTVLANFYLDQCHRHKVLSYFKSRVHGTIEMMEKLDIINRTSELARLFGIQFVEVFSRGSQYRVESMMLRLAKPANLIPFSPTPQQRAFQKAPEFLPLILEPESKYYTDPVAVLDFQSLYPSMIIAYNYCYSTVLGRTDNFGKDETIVLGCGIHEKGNEEISNLDPDSVHISPAGVVFVKSAIKRGIMPQMLEQILETRLMVKKSMKQWSGPEHKTLQKILDSRQLGLKLISNVTYGYTSAHFSGRMPCVEIADSILSKGRETLQRAINLVQENQEKWGGRVVYGDTDSLFVLFAGKSREYAWKMAQDIADEVTKENPKPVKLKLEKIYQPCILQTKKRYVGYAYETPDQKEPKYDAKGIETVRRDGCPAVKKILEVGIRTLFETNNPKELRKYIDFQFRKLFLGRVSLSDYTFARQYRGRGGYKPTASVPSLEIAKKMTLRDPMAEPLTKERVPYVVVYGDPKLPLIKLVHRPIEVVENKNLRLNAHYYIEKVIIPALNRCFQLAKINIQQWYKELPRKYMRAYQGNLDGLTKKKETISDYFISEKCIRCDERTLYGHYFCPKCTDQGQMSAIDLICRLKKIEARYHTAKKICLLCSKDDNKCLNFDCDIFHKLQRFQEDFTNSDKLVKILYLSDW